MSIANSASNKNYFVVAALEYQSLWNGIQKIRLSLEDITDHPCCEERDVKYSGYELERAILRKCYSTSVSSPCGTDVTTIGDNNLCIEAYDTSRRLFIQLSKELDGTVFGKRIRANIVKLLPSQHTEDSTNTEVVVANAEEKRLAITGRFFPYNSATGIIPFAGTKMCVKEVSNNKMGTGLNVWDGSYLLAKYMEFHPEKIRDCGVLELGSGCGLCGIAAGLLGAQEVVMTDLPYALDIMRKNVRANLQQIVAAGCSRIECTVCDWLCPPTSLDQFGFSASHQLRTILVADCVWLERLVIPLLETLQRLTSTFSEASVLISYQRRGIKAHQAFCNGIHTLFDVKVVDMRDDLIPATDMITLIECKRKHKQGCH